ncbi:DRTGG domain-containing protein [uncultured Clostridium sp.]|uniref:DRTGG domain-containing protein n=1 Tax=uncultured Clostridium sp. TaxID=59620 RepID=UPI0028E97EF2|nr:DRTGG domain-containing protein [uncultured Clostridium sp.]
MSKHEEVIRYISSLSVGSKISVRTIASLLNISEGTAYRAIKECEERGIVTTIPRIGTIRIEKVEKRNKEVLTFGEIVGIVDGNIAAGKGGIYKKLEHFIIGAMTPEAIEEYITPGSLFIVGNREEVQELALVNDCGIIITGGFKCSEKIKRLADYNEMPVICTLYDTFTVASMINRAIWENTVKKEIILIEDIMDYNPPYLKVDDNVSSWRKLIEDASQVEFPVVNDEMRFMGLVTLRELKSNLSEDMQIEKLMIKNVTTLEPTTTVAYAAHVIEGEGTQFCPVVDNKRFVGSVKRGDIIKALKHAARQPKIEENIENIVLKKFKYAWEGEQMHFCGRVTSEMLDPIGTASWSALNMLISTMALICLNEDDSISLFVDNISTYFMKPVQIDTNIDAYVNIIDRGKTFCKVMGRSFCKVEIAMYDGKKDLIAKSFVSAQVTRK